MYRRKRNDLLFLISWYSGFSYLLTSFQSIQLFDGFIKFGFVMWNRSRLVELLRFWLCLKWPNYCRSWTESSYPTHERFVLRILCENSTKFLSWKSHISQFRDITWICNVQKKIWETVCICGWEFRFFIIMDSVLIHKLMWNVNWNSYTWEFL